MSGTQSTRPLLLDRQKLEDLDRLEAEIIAKAGNDYSETITGIDSPSQPATSWIFAPEHTLIQRLYERRLSAEVLQYFSIQPHANGWQYPAAGGTRWAGRSSSRRC